MNRHRFIVLDQLSRNQLREFATRAEAEACFRRFVAAEPTAVEHLEIWDDDEDIRLELRDNGSHRFDVRLRGDDATGCFDL